MPDPLARTLLYPAHLALGARLVPFAGWEMPVQYNSIVAEHLAVRNNWGLFDVSHMGRIQLSGAGAAALLDLVVTSGAADLPLGRSRYGLICNPEGGILDDVVFYRQTEQRFLLVCNAGNRAVIGAWLTHHAQRVAGAQLEIISDQTIMLAIQGPHAVQQADGLFSGVPSSLKRFTGASATFQRTPVFLGRTGYTGEDGVEVVAPVAVGLSLWNALIGAGATPVGLGARDTLRLEAGLPLHGNDISPSINPIEAGLERFVRSTGDYIGKAALDELRAHGSHRKLVGFKSAGRGLVPRHGFRIMRANGQIGEVTSGAFSPCLGVNIGLGFVPPACASPGTSLEVDVRGSRQHVAVTTIPFYKRPTR